MYSKKNKKEKRGLLNPTNNDHHPTSPSHSTSIINHKDAATQAGGPSRSTRRTPSLISPLSRTKFEKYLRATSASMRTLPVSSFRASNCSTLRLRPTRSVSVGYLSARRTSALMRVELACV